jgi:hypothetical protein
VKVARLFSNSEYIKMLCWRIVKCARVLLDLREFPLDFFLYMKDLVYSIPIDTIIEVLKAALPRQQLATFCLQHFLVTTGNIKTALHQGNNWQHVAGNIFSNDRQHY